MSARVRIPSLLVVALIASLVVAGPASAQDPPAFALVMSPAVIGPGSASTAVFTIDNSATPTPVSDLAFSLTLPAGVSIAATAPTVDPCTMGALSATVGGGTITLSDGKVGASQSCTLSVEVTSSTADTHTLLTGDLTSSLGNSGTASDDLLVDVDLPGFSKSFAPVTVEFGGRSTLTFLIDNTANASNVANLDFTDNLPGGMAVADPANATTTCGTPTIPPTLTAAPGSATIVLDANGTAGFPAVAAGSFCTVAVDVVARAVGELVNVSDDLLSDSVAAGHAIAALTVRPIADGLSLTKEFTTDPVLPGGTTTLQFTVGNLDRTDAVTDVAFSDDLDAMLTGTTPAEPLPSDPCGPGSTLSFTAGELALAGGTVTAGSTCTFDVDLQIPAGAAGGSYTNTTSNVIANRAGRAVSGNMASDDLFVSTYPILTVEFTDDPVGAGDDVTLEFSVTNPDSGAALTDITFIDDLTFLPSPISVVGPTPDPPCGVGSTFAVVSFGVDQQGLELTGGSLPAAATCTFSVTITVPAGFPGGTYTNTTDVVSATSGGVTVTGPRASDDLVVVEAPTLRMEFTDDPVPPGGTVTLQYTLSRPAESSAGTGDATDITFTHDLAATLAGMTVTSAPASPCDPDGVGEESGTGSIGLSAGDTFITFSGGVLGEGEECSFAVALNVPSGGSGTFPSETSEVRATIASVNTIGNVASDDLIVTGFSVAKEFIADPVIAGDTTVLRFTLDNTEEATETTGVQFSDDLNTVVPGLVAVAPLPPNPCGGSLSGTSFLVFSGGSVPIGQECSFDVTVQVPSATPDDAYRNVTSNISSSKGTAPPAVDLLEVQSTRLQLTIEFTDDPVSAGDPVTAELVLTNLDPTQAASAIAFDDDFGATLAGLTFTSESSDDCNGVAGGVGTTQLNYSGGSLDPGAFCTIVLQLTVPGSAPSGTYPNTTTTVTGMVDGSAVEGEPATDSLEVGESLTFTKGFANAAAAGGTVPLTFTIGNPTASASSGIRFVDSLENMLAGAKAVGTLPARPCGPDSTLTGESIISMTEGSLVAGGTCSFMITVEIPDTAVPSTYTNTTSALGADVDPLAGPATATLTVEGPPGFAKAFSPDEIGVGEVSTLTFTIDNTANTLAASSLAFSDTFPAGMVIADPTGASATCTGGMGDATAGATSFSYGGGSVAAGVTCTVQIDVTATATGINTSEDLTSSLGNSGTATDTLTVQPQPGFSKAFAPDTIAVGGISTLTLTIDNTATTTTTGLSLDDVLPAGTQIAATPDATTTCTGGTLTAPADGSTITYTGGSVPAGASCTVTVDITATTTGTKTNTATLTSDLGNSPNATATLTVEGPPGFAKAFSPDEIGVGEVSTLTFTIDNTANTLAASSLAFSDTFPAGMVIADPTGASATCTGGMGDATAGATSFSYGGGSVAAGVTCTVQIDVTATATGINTSEDLTSSLGNSGTATDTLTVQPQPGFSKAFAPDTIAVGGISTLTLTIDNTATTTTTGLSLDDVLPAGTQIAATPDATTTCTGGTLTAPADGSTITYTGGSVPAGASCTVTVDITATTTGTKTNTATLTSDLGNSPNATATLTVEGPPGFAKAFSPDEIGVGEVSTLTFTIDNTANTLAASSLAFSDTFPAGMVIADPTGASATCTGGMGDATAGATSFSYGGGSVAAGVTCTVQIDVTATATGINTSEDLTSSLGNSGTATDTLTVQPQPGFSKAFAPDTIAVGGISTLTLTIDNTATTTTTGLSLDDVLPAGTQIAATPDATTTCTGGTLTAPADGSTITYTGGSVPAGASCTVTVDITATTTGTKTNTATLTSDLGNSPNATATLTVTQTPGFTKGFAPAQTRPDAPVSLTFTIDNTGNATTAATGLSFTDDLPDDLVMTDPVTITTDTCNGAPDTTNPGVFAYSGGTVAAGATCTVSVDVTAPTTGTKDNTSSALSTSLGDAPPATASLLVTQAPDFSKAFDPAVIAVGGISTLTLTIDNSANATTTTTGLSLDDVLPAGTQIAATPDATTTCTGGTLTAPADGSTITYTGGSVPAGASCTVTVDITATTTGTKTNTATLTSDLGNSPNATATLTVEGPPGFAKAFSPDTVRVGQTSTVTLTIDNTANTLAADDVTFTDPLPTGMAFATTPNTATTCVGGDLTPADDRTASYVSGTVPAGTSCTVTFDVTATMTGTLTNTTSDLRSSLGTTPAASADLVVTAAPAPPPLPPAPAPAPQPGEPGGMTSTVGNDDVIETAIALSQDFPPAAGFAQASDGAAPADHVVLARADVFADALGGSVLTGNAPMLFTRSQKLDGRTEAEIERVLDGRGTVYLLGGEAALSGVVENELEDAGYDVVRLAGASRIQTAIAVATEARRLGGDGRIALARAYGTDDNPTAAWADSVAAGGWAADTGNPILLTATEELHPDIVTWMAQETLSVTFVLGGEAAISTSTQTAVAGPTRRVAGEERAGTAAAIAEVMRDVDPEGPRGYILFNGFVEDGWGYGLAAAHRSAVEDWPLLPTQRTTAPGPVRTAVDGCDTEPVDLLRIGDDALISDELLTALGELDEESC